MKAVAHRRSVPVPTLSLKGSTLLFALALIPAGCAAFNIPVLRAAAAVAFALLCFSAVFIREYLRLRVLLKQLIFQVALPERVYSGRPFEVTAELSAIALDASFDLALKAAAPAGTIFSPEEQPLTIGPGRERATVVFSVTPIVRGKLEFSQFFLRAEEAFGLSRWIVKFALIPRPAPLSYPNRFAKDSIVNPLITTNPGNRVIDQPFGEGREFDSLREYVMGDDLRRVDWKRSSKSSSLYIKVYRPESHQRVMIALDCSRRMGNVIDHRLQLDFAADGAAYLLRLLQRNDDEVGLFAFNHGIVSKLPCMRARTAEPAMLRELVKLKVGSLEADYSLLSAWGKSIRRRSLFLLLTSVSNPFSLEMIRNAFLPLLRKHLPLVVAIADRELEGAAAERAANLDDAYMVAAASQQLNEIRSRIEWLKRSGIEALYCDAANLPIELERTYQTLKLSGRL